VLSAHTALSITLTDYNILLQEEHSAKERQTKLRHWCNDIISYEKSLDRNTTSSLPKRLPGLKQKVLTFLAKHKYHHEFVKPRVGNMTLVDMQTALDKIARDEDSEGILVASMFICAFGCICLTVVLSQYNMSRPRQRHRNQLVQAGPYQLVKVIHTSLKGIAQ